MHEASLLLQKREKISLVPLNDSLSLNIRSLLMRKEQEHIGVSELLNV
jgi:hypothetical protein